MEGGRSLTFEVLVPRKPGRTNEVWGLKFWSLDRHRLSSPGMIRNTFLPWQILDHVPSNYLDILVPSFPSKGKVETTTDAAAIKPYKM
jgi:hypothetical protein